MDLWKILSSYTSVQTVISLVAFIVAAVLGYLAYMYKGKQDGIANILRVADTENKADLARSLMGAFPNYTIPDLTSSQGFQIVKMQMVQKADQFKSNAKTLRLGMILLFLAICALFIRNVSNYITIGPDSPVIKGDSNTIIYGDTTRLKK